MSCEACDRFEGQRRDARGEHGRSCWRCSPCSRGTGAAHAAVAPSPSSGSACPAPNDTNHLVADATKPGVIDLLFFNAKGARVVFYECVGERLERIAARRVPAETQPTMLAAAATWSCDRLVRSFAAFATLPDGTPALGTYSVRTASCANRFALSVPRRVRPGGLLRVRVADRWGIGGIRPQLCVTAAVPLAATCRTLAFQRRGDHRQPPLSHERARPLARRAARARSARADRVGRRRRRGRRARARSRRQCSRRATRRCRASTASSPTSSATTPPSTATCCRAAASAAAASGCDTPRRRPSACASA